MPTWVEPYLHANQPYLYPIVFLLLLLAGLGFPISADLVLLSCAYIAYTKNADYLVLIAAATAGILISDTLMFYIGKHFGLKLTRVWPLSKVLTTDRIERAKSGFQIQGYRIVFLARFMPGIRTVFMFTSGLLRLRYWKFIAYDFSGALIVVPLMIYSVKWVAGNKDLVLQFLHKFQWIILCGVLIYFAYRYKQYSKRRRASLSR